VFAFAVFRPFLPKTASPRQQKRSALPLPFLSSFLVFLSTKSFFPLLFSILRGSEILVPASDFGRMGPVNFPRCGETGIDYTVRFVLVLPFSLPVHHDLTGAVPRFLF